MLVEGTSTMHFTIALIVRSVTACGFHCLFFYFTQLHANSLDSGKIRQ